MKVLLLIPGLVVALLIAAMIALSAYFFLVTMGYGGFLLPMAIGITVAAAVAGAINHYSR